MGHGGLVPSKGEEQLEHNDIDDILTQNQLLFDSTLDVSYTPKPKSKSLPTPPPQSLGAPVEASRVTPPLPKSQSASPPVDTGAGGAQKMTRRQRQRWNKKQAQSMIRQFGDEGVDDFDETYSITGIRKKTHSPPPTSSGAIPLAPVAPLSAPCPIDRPASPIAGQQVVAFLQTNYL